MARSEDLLYAPSKWSVVDSQVAGACTATKAASTAGQRHFITGISISASAAPVSAMVAQLLDGVTVLDQWEIPAAAFSPIVLNFVRPFRGSANTLASLTLSTGGAGVTTSITLRGFTASD